MTTNLSNLSTSPLSLPRQGISLQGRSAPGSRGSKSSTQAHQLSVIDSKGFSFFEELHKRSSPGWSATPLPLQSRAATASQQTPHNVTVGFQTSHPHNSSTVVTRPALRPGLLSAALSSSPHPARQLTPAAHSADLFTELRVRRLNCPGPCPPLTSTPILNVQDTTVSRAADQNLSSITLLPLQILQVRSSSQPAPHLHHSRASVLFQEKHDVFKNDTVKLAYLLCERAHRGQLRKNGDPTLQHCVETAAILADLGLDLHIVAAGLLHDILRDTCISKYELQEYMPTHVVSLVEAVTRVSKVSQAYRSMGQAGQAEQVVTAVTALGTEAVLVKLADRLHNMRTISGLPSQKQLAMAQETLEVYSVLANRLGLWSLKAELEDLSFKVLHPREYSQLLHQVEERQSLGFLQESVDQLKQFLDRQGIEVEDISGRPKNLYGIYTKMVKDGLQLDQVYDVYALRVIVKQKEQCYVVRDRVCALWQPLQARSKDYIRNKKPNGYQSLHETVFGQDGLPFEVQIRTSKMHYIAEYGSSAHWQYKEGTNSDREMADVVKWMRWEAQCQHGINDKKVRPMGSPQKDMSLSSLGWEFVGSSDEKVDPLLLNRRVGLKKVAENEVQFPVSVSVRNFEDSSERLYELAAGSTLGDLLTACKFSQLELRSYCIKLNDQQCTNMDRVLSTGDDVRIQPLQPAQPSHPFSSGRITLYNLGVTLQRPAGVTAPRLFLATASAS
jgi:ppGpp synthetase/RelA/SpoT-type nucleotidyltranferase